MKNRKVFFLVLTKIVTLNISLNILIYSTFWTNFSGAGVLYRGNNDASYGLNLAFKLKDDGYRVLYLNVSKGKHFYYWFNGAFQNIFWYSAEIPRHFLYGSNLVVILDNFDNMLDSYDFDDRSGYCNNLAIVYAANGNFFKPIFIISKKEYANEVLQYNGHTKYYNLFRKDFYRLVD